MNIQSAKERLGKKLSNVSEIAAGVFRGVRRNGERDMAAYVFDLNNRVPKKAGELSDYLDEVMGPAYFDKETAPDLRWNNYLYFVVDKEQAGNQAFQTLKRSVETDRSYARKFIVVEEELDQVLAELDSVATIDASVAAGDVVKTWSEGLGAVGLADVLDLSRPISDIVRGIASGAAKQSARTKKTTGVEASEKLVAARIQSLDLTDFRPFPKKKKWETFGKANLLFGTNGTGKTSLLESLEFLYCGANRRSPALGTSTVTAVLGNGHLAKTTGLQQLSDFKTRQRIWYGSDDNTRENRLAHQFGRFNFLNTDAAAELSLAGTESGQVAESLAALLSGHEASEMWRRIQATRTAVAKEMKDTRAERAVADSDFKARQQELHTLEAAPSQSDAAFSILKKDLEHIGWRDALETKGQVEGRLVDTLSAVASRLNAVRQVAWLTEAVTPAAIARQAALMGRASEGLQPLLNAANEDVRLRGILLMRRKAALERLDALAAIPSSAWAQLNELISKLKSAEGELVQTAQADAALPTSVPPNGWELIWGSKPVLEAASTASAVLLASSTQLEEAKQNLAALMSKQSALQGAVSELHSWAKKVIEHQHSDSACPVCGTGFQPGQLLDRMQSLAAAPAVTVSTELRLQIERLTARLAQERVEAAWLTQLSRFVLASSGNAAPWTVAEAMEAATELKGRRRDLQESRGAARDGLDAFAKAGLSLEALERLCQPIDGEVQSAAIPLDLAAAASRIQAYSAQLQAAIDELDRKTAQRSLELHRRFEPTGLPVGESLASAAEQLHERYQSALHADEACSFAKEYLGITPESNLESLSSSLEAALLGAKKVLASMASESESTSRLTAVRAKLQELSGRMSRYRDALERLAGAQRVLDEVIENQSLDAANSAVVAATHTVADSIFKRIHVPAEYLISADTGVPLRRRDTNAPVQLNQVSTGQRAAYALSMFLAMNAQVTAGPKVILLDDPISHIDDLNALSFLDYLRNLVLKSDRQVFFATADEKVAGLFSHKFGFLGDDFRTLMLTRS